MKSLEERFNEKWIPEPFSGCWLWIGAQHRYGYGQIWDGDYCKLAHRVSFELDRRATIPDGMCVCHTCDIPQCVNPMHLFLGTKLDNTADAIRKNRFNTQGEHCGKAKLSQDDVLHIRKSIESKNALAARFGVNRSTISRIQNHKRWNHLL